MVMDTMTSLRSGMHEPGVSMVICATEGVTPLDDYTQDVNW